MNFIPLHDRIVIREEKLPEETESGIILQGARASNDTRISIVVSVGPDVQEVKAGDKIYLSWSKVKPFKNGDEFLGIINEEDVLAVIEEE